MPPADPSGHSRARTVRSPRRAASYDVDASQGTLRLSRVIRIFESRAFAAYSLKMPLRILGRGCLLFLALGCAPAAGVGSDAGAEATLVRGGGLSGASGTIHISLNRAVATAEWCRSDSRRCRAVHLANGALSNILANLDSLAAAVPVAEADTGAIRVACGDVVTTHLSVRRGSHVRTVQEACPHGGAQLDVYWSRVNGLFDVLANAAR